MKTTPSLPPTLAQSSVEPTTILLLPRLGLLLYSRSFINCISVIIAAWPIKPPSKYKTLNKEEKFFFAPCGNYPKKNIKNRKSGKKISKNKCPDGHDKRTHNSCNKIIKTKIQE